MLAANGKITIRQLQILIILSALGTGVIVLPRRVAQFAGQDGWVIVIGLTLLAVLVGLLICTAISAATKAKPHAGFIEFTGHLLTRPFAYFCGVLLWLKLVLAAGLELRVFLEITQNIMLPRTPLPVVSFAVLLLCAYAAAKGIETRARVAEILFAVMALPFLFLVGLAIFDTDFSNLQPVLVTPPQNILHGTLRLGFIFTGLECLLLVSPFIRKKGKNMGRHVAHALAFSGVIILVITVLTIAKFGHGVANQPWPVLRMMDMINIPGSFIERQEALMFSFWIITAFAIGNTMLFFGGVLVKDMFRPRAKHLGVIVTAFAAFAVSVFPWQGDVYRVLDYMYMTVGVFFLVILPLFLLLAAKFRNRQTVTRAATLGLLLLTCATLFTACWDRVEIENRAFVVSIGIDEKDGEYEVSLSVPLLKKDDDEESKPHIKTATAQTIAQALHLLDAKTDKTLYYGQAKLLVLGDSLLQNPDMTSTVIQAMKHKAEIDLRINVLAAEGSAKDILEAKPPGETLPGLFVADIYRNKNKLGGESFALDLERLANSYHNGAIIPVIQQSDCDSTPLKLYGAAVINNRHTVGKLSQEELQGYLWCMSHGNNGAIVTVEIGGKNVPVTIEKHSAKIEFEPCTAGVRAIVNVKLLAELETSLPSGITQNDIQHKVSKQIAKEIATTAELLQSKYAVDGYDWLELLRKKNYKLYQENYQNSDVTFTQMEILPTVVLEFVKGV